MSKLTKRVVDAAEVRASEYFIWDEELPGFGLRVLPSGRKRYIIQYRAGRRPVAPHQPWTQRCADLRAGT